jgi:hypothetical protein
MLTENLYSEGGVKLDTFSQLYGKENFLPDITI